MVHIATPREPLLKVVRRRMHLFASHDEMQPIRRSLEFRGHLTGRRLPLLSGSLQACSRYDCFAVVERRLDMPSRQALETPQLGPMAHPEAPQCLAPGTRY